MPFIILRITFGPRSVTLGVNKWRDFFLLLLRLSKRWHTATAAAVVGSVATDIPERSKRQSASGLRIRIRIRIRASAVETRQSRPSWSGGAGGGFKVQ